MPETLGDTQLGNVEAGGIFDTLADNPSEIKAKTPSYTLGDVDFEALLDRLAHTLAEVEVEKPADTLCDVKALELVQVLPCTLDTDERYEGRDTGRVGRCHASK